MRHWLLHPLIFYPLAAVLAAVLIAISVRPQAWPRPPAPVSGAVEGEALVLEGDALGAPEGAAGQRVFVTRDFFGHATALSIAAEPGIGEPGAEDQGVRILLSPQALAALPDGPLVAEVRYNPIPVNAASALAARMDSTGAALPWAVAPLETEPGIARLVLRPDGALRALELRVVSHGTDQAYGVEITRIRILPHTGVLRTD